MKKYDVANERINKEITDGIEAAKELYTDGPPMTYNYAYLRGLARGYLIEAMVYKEEIARLRNLND